MIELASIPESSGRPRRIVDTFSARTAPLVPEAIQLLTPVERTLYDRLGEIRLDMISYVQAWFAKNSGNDYDFKEVKKQIVWILRAQSAFAVRLFAIEKHVGLWPPASSTGKGHWKPHPPSARETPVEIPPGPKKTGRPKGSGFYSRWHEDS
jgi:hypothetical protein